MRLPLILPLLLCSALLAGCTPSEPRAKPWREELTIAVSLDQKSVDTEFRQQLIDLFSGQLQVPVRLVPMPPGQMVAAIQSGRVHLAAEGFRSNAPLGGVLFTPVYQTVSEQVVCLTSPQRLSELAGKRIAVISGSAHEAALRELQQTMPELNWESRPQGTTDDLLNEVAAGTLECAAANGEQVAMAHNFHPQLGTALDIAKPSQLAWAFAPNGDPALYQAGKDFFEKIGKDGTLHRLMDRYYSNSERMEPVDSTAYLSAIYTVLPRYRSMFEEAAQLTGIEWQLLAALSYQESHWDPLATSFTGVRGMMMLIGETADHMNVKDRLDPRESIIGGARFLLLLKDQLPARIPEEERIWMAIAAYNQGVGHLNDARMLAEKAGMNPNSWADVRKTMHWLERPEYASQTRYGYARGGEAVALVEGVRLYYDMLKRIDMNKPPVEVTPTFQLHMPKKTKEELPP
ncbi:MAG: membrane-bound lytic murein transglycosylase MltF [Gallionellaceae bacterium]|jgi:membrane-bound lytic murein transglycosylase F|nr:membrane-bound lytic murein transglycosylase MltF [Gallionellaceae bacterium]